MAVRETLVWLFFAAETDELILTVSLIAPIIRYRFILLELSRFLPRAAEGSFRDRLNFNFLLGVLFACFFWFSAHSVPLS
jgi:hypothetical protein